MVATSATAGDYETPASVDVAPVVAAGVDWSGFYAGGIVSFDRAGEAWFTFNGSETTSYDLDPLTGYGGFVGYNIQKGAIVFGGEIAYSSGGMVFPGFPDTVIGYYLDLRARVGYATGPALIYGVIGSSGSHFDTSYSYSINGLVYGGGVDYLIGEHVFVGAEYLVRSDISGEGDAGGYVGHHNVQSAELRVGWKF